MRNCKCILSLPRNCFGDIARRNLWESLLRAKGLDLGVGNKWNISFNSQVIAEITETFKKCIFLGRSLADNKWISFIEEKIKMLNNQKKILGHIPNNLMFNKYKKLIWNNCLINNQSARHLVILGRLAIKEQKTWITEQLMQSFAHISTGHDFYPVSDVARHCLQVVLPSFKVATVA